MSQPDLELHTSVACLKEKVAQHADLHVEHRDAIRSLVQSMASREGWFKGIGTVVAIASVASAAVGIHSSLARASAPASAVVAPQQKAAP